MLKKIKEGHKLIQKEIRERTLGYIVAALGLVAGLAWNEAIKGLIEYAFPLSKDTVQAKFVYAGIITLVVVILTYILAKILGNSEDKKP